MCTSHSVMEGQRHNNPLNPRCFCIQRPKRDGSVTHTQGTHIYALQSKRKKCVFRRLDVLFVQLLQRVWQSVPDPRRQRYETPVPESRENPRTRHVETATEVDVVRSLSPAGSHRPRMRPCNIAQTSTPTPLT